MTLEKVHVSKDICVGGYKVMYHIVPEIGSSNYIVVHWDCHGVVRLVLSNDHILFPRL